MTFDPPDVYKTLEPLLADYRKLKRRVRTGYTLTHIDQFIDELLTKDRVCATSLWKLPARQQLEDLDLLEERISPLGKEIDEIDADGEGEDGRGPDGRRGSEEQEEESEHGQRNGHERGEIDGSEEDR